MTPPKGHARPLVCQCGCGNLVPQVKGNKKKHFLDTEHYEKWRAERRASGGQDAMNKRENSPDLAPVMASAEAIRAEAAVTRVVTGAASHALWGACLGVAL